jgi:4-hydroxybenzoate polyprenyltransferase
MKRIILLAIVTVGWTLIAAALMPSKGRDVPWWVFLGFAILWGLVLTFTKSKKDNK